MSNKSENLIFKWHKKGKIFSPNNISDWMYSHSQCPFTLDFGDFVRVYFSTREAYKDGMSKAHGGWVDLDKNDLTKVLNVADKPLMNLGGVGEFDEFGSMPNSIIKHNDKYYLYYCGWNRGFTTPYSWEIGIAESDDAKRFVKMGKGPIIGPTLHEPYLHACPIVYKFADDDWHMFYLSGIRWLDGKEKKESQYLLMHATSKNGVDWQRNATPVIEPVVPFESQTSAAIIKIEDTYHMFFCYRQGLDFRNDKDKNYKIGYACSKDLINWNRDDSKAGIDISDNDWDSEMIGYPHIAKINDKYVMFYCGNYFGRDGFGYAELEITKES